MLKQTEGVAKSDVIYEERRATVAYEAAHRDERDSADQFRTRSTRASHVPSAPAKMPRNRREETDGQQQQTRDVRRRNALRGS